MTCSCYGKHDFLVKLHKAKLAYQEELGLHFQCDRAFKIQIAKNTLTEAGLSEKLGACAFAEDLVRLHECEKDVLLCLQYIQHAWIEYQKQLAL